MTLEQRIEAAERYIQTNLDWHGTARHVLQAAFPELFTAPPQAWLAPWDHTEEMSRAAYGALNDHWGNGRQGVLILQGFGEVAWEAMRTAYLAKDQE